MGGLMPRRRDHDCGSDQVTVTDLAESETAILDLRQQVADLTTTVHAQQAQLADVVAVIEGMRLAAASVAAACTRKASD